MYFHVSTTLLLHYLKRVVLNYYAIQSFCILVFSPKLFETILLKNLPNLVQKIARKLLRLWAGPGEGQPGFHTRFTDKYLNLFQIVHRPVYKKIKHFLS